MKRLDERPPRPRPPATGRGAERRERPARPEDWLDEAIQDAEARGLFRDLPGRGRPLDLGVNPFEPAEWRLGHRLLREHGFAPEWIQLDREIREGMAAARGILETALELAARTAPPPGPPPAERRRSRWLARWLRLPPADPPVPPPDPERLAAEAERRFRERVAEINRLVERYNLLVPIPWLQRRPIDPEGELAAFRARWREAAGRPGGPPTPPGAPPASRPS